MTKLKYRIAVLFNDKVWRSNFLNTLEGCQNILYGHSFQSCIKSTWIEVVR